MRSYAGITSSAVLIALASNVFAQQPASRPSTTQPLDRAALEAQFEETMSNAVLVGRFTRAGSDAAPKEDRYTIVKASKRDGDNWLFQTRMRYGGVDLVLPLLIPVRWAGDTAMIQVTDMSIPPGSGPYSARVLIYRGQYAGTWSGPRQSGQMFGRIERAPTTTTTPSTMPAR